MIWIFLSVLLTLGLVALGVINKTNQSQMRSKVTREAKDAYNRAERNGTSPEELQSMQADLDRYCKDAIDGAKVLIPGIVVGVGWTCVCVFFALGMFNKVFFYADPSMVYHIKTISGTESHAAGKTGYVWYGFGSYTPWKQGMTVLAGSEGGPDVSASMPSDDIMFLDQVDANADAMIRYTLPTDEASFLRIVHNYRTPENLLRASLIPAFQETLQATASLMTANEYFSGGRTEFINEFSNQMKKGSYVVKREEVETHSSKDQTSEADASDPSVQDIFGDGMKTEFVVTKVLEDDGITPKRSPQEFLNYGIQVVETRVTQVKPTSQKFLEQIQLKIKASADRAVAREQKIQEEEQRLLAVAKGDRQVAEQQADMKVEQMKVTTTAETAKKEALIKATLLKEQALISKMTAQTKFEQAEIDAKSVKVAADAEAYRKKAIMTADNALKDKLEAEIKIQQVWADAYASRAVPSTVIGSNGATPVGSDTEAKTLMSLMTVDFAKRLAYDRGITPNTGADTHVQSNEVVQN